MIYKWCVVFLHLVEWSKYINAGKILDQSSNEKDG